MTLTTLEIMSPVLYIPDLAYYLNNKVPDCHIVITQKMIDGLKYLKDLKLKDKAYQKQAHVIRAKALARMQNRYLSSGKLSIYDHPSSKIKSAKLAEMKALMKHPRPFLSDKIDILPKSLISTANNSLKIAYRASLLVYADKVTIKSPTFPDGEIPSLTPLIKCDFHDPFLSLGSEENQLYLDKLCSFKKAYKECFCKEFPESVSYTIVLPDGRQLLQNGTLIISESGILTYFFKNGTIFSNDTFETPNGDIFKQYQYLQFSKGEEIYTNSLIELKTGLNKKSYFSSFFTYWTT